MQNVKINGKTMGADASEAGWTTADTFQWFSLFFLIFQSSSAALVMRYSSSVPGHSDWHSQTSRGDQKWRLVFTNDVEQDFRGHVFSDVWLGFIKKLIDREAKQKRKKSISKNCLQN